jgi:RimJ/RimL family protein N-acetyltransferase
MIIDLTHLSTQEAKKTLGESKDWMLHNIKSSQRPWIDNYAILVLPTPSEFADQNRSGRGPKMIGCVGVIRSIEVAEGQRLEIGYMINYDYWGRGYASEALGAFLDLCFSSEDPKVGEVVAKVDTENWASIRILRKMEERGYKIREGELVKGDFAIPGKGLRDMRTWYICQNSSC